VTARSVWPRETGADVFSVTGDELTLDEGADRAGVPVRAELSGALAVGAGVGVFQTE